MKRFIASVLGVGVLLGAPVLKAEERPMDFSLPGSNDPIALFAKAKGGAYICRILYRPGSTCLVDHLVDA